MATGDIPRWAKPLGTDTWERINELLYEGWDLSDLMRKLKIPDSKKRSLQVHARKFGPRRRLLQFAMFKDALVAGAADMGSDFARAMTLIAKCAVSEDVKTSTQQRACDLMNTFAKTIEGLMKVDAEAEQKRERDEKGTTEQVDVDEALRRILDVYGVRRPEDRNG